MIRLLALRNARLYLTGATLSLFGDTALYLAAGVWVKTLTGSSSAAGLLFFVLGLPSVLAPVAGWLVDRVRRRLLLMLANVATGALVLLLVRVHGKDDVWLIYLVMLGYGASYTIINSAQSALFTVMVPQDLLGHNNAAMQTIGQGLFLIGPLAGAALFAWQGGSFVAVLDALTFAIAAAAIGCVRVAEPPPEPKARHVWIEMAAGVRHILHTVRLRQVLLAGTLASLVFGFGMTLIFAVVDHGLHRPPAFLGALMGVLGIGGLLGGLTAARIMVVLGEGLSAGAGLLLGAVGSPLLTLGSLPTAFLGMLLWGIGLSWMAVGTSTLVQRTSPSGLQGRVASAAGAVLGTTQLVSIALGAALVTMIDYRVLVLAMAAVLTTAGLYLVTRREQRAWMNVHAAPGEARPDRAADV
jgi:MFS family permease